MSEAITPKLSVVEKLLILLDNTTQQFQRDINLFRQFFTTDFDLDRLERIAEAMDEDLPDDQLGVLVEIAIEVVNDLLGEAGQEPTQDQ
jgi:hypothetical protein